MAKEVICVVCKQKNNKEKMRYIKSIKRYVHHGKCYKKYVEHKRFKEKENQELTDLVETIKEVHGIKVIPRQFFSYLQDLRNDSVLFGKLKKKYKQGIPYPIIAATYKYCESDIRYWINKKEFDNILNELKYCLAIVKNKIDIVDRKMQKTKERSNVEKRVKNQKQLQKPDSNNKSKGVDELDISDLL